MKAQLKTQKNDNSIEQYLDTIEDKQKVEDTKVIMSMIYDIIGKEPKLWGDSLIGFGDITYKYASGRTGEWFVLGFAPRKQNISIYLTCNIELYADYLLKLGKYKTGKGCLYIKKLSDIDINILKEMFLKAAKECNPIGSC